MTELASWYYLAPDGCYYGPAPFEKMEHWLRKGRVPHSTPIAPFPHGPYFPATHYWLPYSGTLKRRVNFDVWFYRLHDRADAREYGPHSMAGCFELYYKREVIKPESMVRVAELSEGDYCLQDVWPQWDEVFRMAPPPEPEEQEEEEPAEEEEVEVPAEPEKPPDGMLAIMGDFRIVQIDSNGALREKVVQGHVGATSSTSPKNARSPSHHRSTYGAPRALSTTYGDEQLQGHQHQGSTIVQGGGRGGSSYMSLSSRTTTGGPGAVGALSLAPAPSRIEGDWFYGEDGKNRIRITDGLEVADFLITLIVDGSVVEGSLRAEGGGGLLTDGGGAPAGAWNVGTIAKQGTIAVKRVSPIYLEVKFKPPKAKGWLASVFAWPRFSFTVKGKWAGPFSNFQCRAWFLEGRFKRGTGEEGDPVEEAATLFRLGNDPEHRSYTLDELFPPPYQNSCFALDVLPHSRNPYNESTIAADSVPIPPSAAVARTSRQTTVPAAIHVAPRPQATRASSSAGTAAGAGAGVAGAGGAAASQEAELAQQLELEFEEQQRVAASTVVLRSGGESGGGGAPASRGSQAASLSFGQPSVVELRGAPSAVMGSVLLPEQPQAVPGVDVAAYPLAYPNMAAGTGSAGGGMYSAAPPPLGGSFYQAAGAPPSSSINSDAFSLMFPSQLSRANGSAFVEHQAPASSSSSAAGEQFGSRLSSEMPSMLRAPSLYSVGFQPRSSTNALGSGMNYPAAPGAFAGAGGRTAAVAGGSSSSTARPSFRVSEGYGVTRASGVMNNELATISIASSTAPARPSFAVSSGYSVIRPSFTEEQTSTYYNERSSFPESAISAIPSSVAAPGSDLFAIKSEGPSQVLPSMEGTHAQEAPARTAASRHLQSGAGTTGGGKKSVTFGSAADARNDPSWWVPSAGPAEQINFYAEAPTGTGRSSSSSSAIGLPLPSSMQQGRLQHSSLVGLPTPSSIMSAGEQEQQQREERSGPSVVGLPRPSSMLRQEEQGLHFQSSMGTGTGSRQYGSSTALAGGEVLDEVKNTSQAQYRMEIEMQDRMEQMQQLQPRSSEDHHREKVSWWVPSSAGDYDNGGVGLGTSAQAPPLIQATSQEGAGAPPPGHHRSLVMRKAKSGVRESGMLMEQFLQRGRAEEEREPQSGAGGGEGELPISSWWRPTEQED